MKKKKKSEQTVIKVGVELETPETSRRQRPGQLLVNTGIICEHGGI